MGKKQLAKKQDILISAIITGIGEFMSFIVGSAVCYTLLAGRTYPLKGGVIHQADEPKVFWIFTSLHAVFWAFFMWSTFKSLKNTTRLKKEARE